MAKCDTKRIKRLAGMMATKKRCWYRPGLALALGSLSWKSLSREMLLAGGGAVCAAQDGLEFLSNVQRLRLSHVSAWRCTSEIRIGARASSAAEERHGAVEP